MTKVFTPVFFVGLVVSIFATSITVNAQYLDQQWHLAIDKNDIEVFTYKGHEVPVRGFKAKTTIGMPIDSFETILDEVSKYADWQDQVRSAKVVHKKSDDIYHFYAKVDVPFPGKDRDLIWAVHKEWDAQDGVLIYDQVCSTNTLPERIKESAITQVFGNWRLRPVSESEVEVTYILMVDRAGRMTSWLLHMLNPDTPYNMLNNLRNLPLYLDDEIEASLD